MDRRERWFVEGAAALRRTLTAIGRQDDLPPTGEFYACPCCRAVYGRDALDARVLTEEHVPPESVGGRKLLLTCKRCNNTAGSTLDAPAARREAIHDFLAGRAPDHALRAEFTVGDITTGGDIRRVDDAFLLFFVPERSNPKHIEEATRTLDAWSAGESAGGRMGSGSPSVYRLCGRDCRGCGRPSWPRS